VLALLGMIGAPGGRGRLCGLGVTVQCDGSTGGGRQPRHWRSV